VPAAGRQGGLNSTAFSSLRTRVAMNRKAVLQQSIRDGAPAARHSSTSPGRSQTCPYLKGGMGAIVETPRRGVSMARYEAPSSLCGKTEEGED